MYPCTFLVSVIRRKSRDIDVLECSKFLSLFDEHEFQIHGMGSITTTLKKQAHYQKTLCENQELSNAVSVSKLDIPFPTIM